METQLTTIAEAKEYLREHAKKGVDCPVCNQRVQIYERLIYSSLALSLIRLYWLTRENPNKPYFHISDFTIDGKTIAGDFSKFRYWGLAVEKEKDASDTTRRTSGYWAITEKGKDFLLGKISVPKRAVIYNSRCLGFSEEKATIQEALGKDFNYQDLMGKAFQSEQSALFSMPPRTAL